MIVLNPDYYYEKAERKNDWTHGTHGVLKDALDFIVSKFEAGALHAMLEIGCGMADIASYLPRGLKYTGLDSGAYAVAESKKKYPEHEFVLGNADKLPFQDASFDIIFSHQVIEMLMKPKEALLEMARVVQPGGYVIIIAPNHENPWSRINAVRHYSKIKKSIFIISRFGDVAMRIFGLSKFRIIPRNYVDVAGKFEMSDDDLRYVTSAWEIAQLFKSSGFKIIHSKQQYYRLDSFKNFMKSLIVKLPSLRYYGGGMFFIFQRRQ